MTILKMQQTQSTHVWQELGQKLRIEQANLLEMPEEEFAKIIAEIEQSPLFQRMYRREKLIHHQRFPRTNISSSFYQLEEERTADKGAPDIDSFLLGKENVIHCIKKVGLEKFKRYFLLPEAGIPLAEIAKENGLEISEVKEINKLIDELSIMNEFYHPSTITSGVIRYSKIASVEKDSEGFTIGYFIPSLAQGRYSIDYERFEELKTTGALTESEVRETRKLLKKLELINSRKGTLIQILQGVIAKQAIYLESGDMKALLPFTQKELAMKIRVTPSSISRAIKDKSIDTPWGEEIPLKHLFPSPKRFKKELLRQILKSDDNLISDEVIRIKLLKKFGVAISRRSVANLRKELKILPTGRRGHHSEGGKE